MSDRLGSALTGNHHLQPLQPGWRPDLQHPSRAQGLCQLCRRQSGGDPGRADLLQCRQPVQPGQFLHRRRSCSRSCRTPSRRVCAAGSTPSKVRHCPRRSRSTAVRLRSSKPPVLPTRAATAPARRLPAPSASASRSEQPDLHMASAERTDAGLDGQGRGVAWCQRTVAPTIPPTIVPTVSGFTDTPVIRRVPQR